MRKKALFIIIVLQVTIAFATGRDYVEIPLENSAIWGIADKPFFATDSIFLSSRVAGENKTGVIVSPVFTVTDDVLKLKIRGWDGREGNAGKNRFELLDAQTNDVLIKTSPPQMDGATVVKLDTKKLIGKKVRIQVVDGDNTGAYAWLALDAVDAGRAYKADFSKGEIVLEDWEIIAEAENFKPDYRDFDGIPFNVNSGFQILPDKTHEIQIGFKAERIYLLGMTNSYDQGCPVWARIEHYEQRYFIGDQLGDIVVTYEDGDEKKYPLTLGESLWWGRFFYSMSEPFVSDEKAIRTLSENLKLYPPKPVADGRYLAFFEPLPKVITSIKLVDSPTKDGAPVIVGITAEVETRLKSQDFTLLKPGVMKPELKAFVSKMPLTPFGTDSQKKQESVKALKNLLYTTKENFPQSVKLSMPDNYSGPKVEFQGDAYAQVLTNIFHYNLKDMALRVDETGMYHTSSGKKISWGGYSGFGTWSNDSGSYYIHCWARDMGRAVMELAHLGLIDEVLRNADYAILQGRIWEEGEIPGIQIIESHGMKVGPFDIDGQKIPYHWVRILNIPGVRNGWQDNDSHGLTMMQMRVIWEKLPNKN